MKKHKRTLVSKLTGMTHYLFSHKVGPPEFLEADIFATNEEMLLGKLAVHGKIKQGIHTSQYTHNSILEIAGEIRCYRRFSYLAGLSSDHQQGTEKLQMVKCPKLSLPVKSP